MQPISRKTVEEVLSLAIILALALSWLPSNIAAQVRDEQSYVSFLLGIGNAEKAATNKDVRAELKVARKLIEDARDAVRVGRNDAAISSFSRARSVVRHIVDEPRDESADVQEKVAELLRALETFPGIGNNPGTRASTETGFGLHTTTFDTLQGTVTVNLPDDISAGDAISGTVIAEPKGKTEAERTSNQDQLNGLVVEIENQHTSPKENVAKFAIPASASVIAVLLKNREGKEVARAQVPLSENAGEPKPGKSNSEYDNKQLARDEKSHPQTGGLSAVPVLAQAGRPIAVKGLFDGDLTSSSVTVAGQPTKLLAESPRQIIAVNPVEAVGKTEIEVRKHEKLITKGSYRSIGLKLSAAKLNLLRGETTQMTLAVLGVANLEEPCSVRLVNGAPWVVSMSGGQSQIIAIEPSDVHTGTYTTTRTLTGVHPGGFAINATIVPAGVAPSKELSSQTNPNPGPPPRDDIVPAPTIKSVSVAPPPVPQAPPPVVQTAPPSNRTPAHACYRVVLTGFTVNHQTSDNVLEADGQGDEVYIVADVAKYDQHERVSLERRPLGNGPIIHGLGPVTFRRNLVSVIMGDINFQHDPPRIRAGSASGSGGLRTSDSFPAPNPWVVSSPPQADRPPMLLWEGELVEGRDFVVVIPTIWEWDGGNNELRSQWMQSVNHKLARDPYFGRSVPGPSIAIAGLDIFGAGDRPIGETRDGYSCRSRPLLLTYELAQEFAAGSPSSLGPGVIEIRYVEEAGDGDYSIYVRVEQVACPRAEARARVN